jgi:hypothetical protein
MDEHDFLAAQFEEHRAHLRAVAYKMKIDAITHPARLRELDLAVLDD